VIRAVLKAADLCASKPEAAAQLIVEGGFTKRYEYALQTLTENPYAPGGNTTPRTPYASMRCGCMSWA
jgi:hypothetical protein